MAFLLKKSLLLGSTLALPALALTSCAGNSQYGTVASIDVTYTPTSAVADNEFDLNDKHYGYNNLNGTSATYIKNNGNWVSQNASGYASSLSTLAIAVGQSVEELVKASLIGFTKDQASNIIFDNENDSNIKNLRQFLYASSNILNTSEGEQIGFGLTSVGFSISGESLAPSDGATFQVVSQKNRQLGYTSKNTVTFSFGFSYWDSHKDNPTSNSVDSSKVKNYLEKHSVWQEKFDTYYNSFTINLNLQARLQSVFTVSEDWAKDGKKQHLDNWKDGEYLKNSDASGNYTYDKNTDLDQFRVNAKTDEPKKSSTFSNFNIQFKNVGSTDSEFLNKFGTYNDGGVFTNNVSTLTDQITNLRASLKTYNAQNKDFVNKYKDSLKFVKP